MKIMYTWRNLPKSDSIEELLNKKLEKLDRHFDHVDHMHVNFSIEGKQDQHVHAIVHLPGAEIYADASAKDMYQAIDAMTHKLIRQIEAHKAKLIEHRDQKPIEKE